MTVEEALERLTAAGLVARDARRNPPLLIMGGESAQKIDLLPGSEPVELFKKPFQILQVESRENPIPLFVARTATRGQLTDEKEGAFTDVVSWVIAKYTVA